MLAAERAGLYVKITIVSSTLCVVLCYWFMGNSSSQKMTEPVVKGPKGDHQATLIFLHGLGDTGDGWARPLAELQLDNFKIVCPTAFDIYGLTPEAKQDEKGIVAASNNLKELIIKEAKDVPLEKIFIGGFSQGGAVALYTALTLGEKLGGIIGLSTWLPLHTSIENRIKDRETLKNIPMFQGHGTADNLVPFTWGSKTKDHLTGIITKYQLKPYPNMGHTSCTEELADVRSFILENQ